MDELLEQFLVEAPELSQQASADLIALERRPGDRALLDSAFRAVHTLKGSVGLFDLAPMERMLHAAEDQLARVREGEAVLDAETIDLLLSAIDQTDRWLADIVVSGGLAPGAEQISHALCARLQGEADNVAAPTVQVRTTTGDWAPALVSRHPDAADARSAICYIPSTQAYFSGDDPLAIVAAIPGIVAREVGLARPVEGDYDPFSANLIFHLLSTASAAEIKAAVRLVSDQVEVIDLAPALRSIAPVIEMTPASIRSLRVDPDRVDHLADLVDELVVAKNGLADLLGSPGSDQVDALRRSQEAIDRITSGLHRGVMRLRLTAIAPVLRRLSRQGRDIAASLDKPALIEIEGDTVEADKAIVDGLYEPLLHILRNALDHGVETPDRRATAGKPERAHVRIAAMQRGENIRITVSDDGGGVDLGRVRDVAVKRGLLDAAQANDATSDDLLALIFAPGFSTARTVSTISGRGVGMDAVQAAVTELGGRVDLSSEPGQGSTVTITLPLTLVMTRILVVEAAGDRFGVPLQDVVETLSLSADRVVAVRHGRAFALRQQTLPLLDLGAVLGGPPGDPGTVTTTLIVAGPHGPVGLSVNRILERRDVVMRPLSGLLSRTSGMAGTTLLGDGQVLMILDTAELVA